jgi:hypothetical protein
MRVANWQVVLRAEFSAAHGRRFRWGYNDCCQFVGRVSYAITGIDRRESFDRYRSRSGAEELLQQFGGMRGLLIHAFGEPMPNKAFASMGDIVLIDMGMGPQPAVCMGLNSFAPGRSSLESRKTALAIDAWTI